MKVYVAGPFTQGERYQNIIAACRAADLLAEAGYYPFVPHTMFSTWEVVTPHDYGFWMSMCLHWVTQCDVIVVLPGYSPGAETEVAVALANGIPVYYGVEDFLGAEGQCDAA